MWVIVISLIRGDVEFAKINTTLGMTIVTYTGGGSAAGLAAEFDRRSMEGAVHNHYDWAG
jgi:hypothetical protein